MPFTYSQIGFAAVLSWVVFSHAPDNWAIVYGELRSFKLAVLQALHCFQGEDELPSGHRRSRR